MRLLLNIIWFFFAGLWLAISYAAIGLVLCLLVVTLPAGMMCFRIAGYVIWPFGRYVEDMPQAGTGSLLLNILWIVTFGFLLALSHVLTAIALAVTIIGIPMAWANIKLVPLALMPFGKRIVTR